MSDSHLTSSKQLCLRIAVYLRDRHGEGVYGQGITLLKDALAVLERTVVEPTIELEVARGLKVMGSPDAIKKAQVKITFAQEMMDACVYLSNAIPVRGFPDNAARVRAAADELLRLRATQPPVVADDVKHYQTRLKHLLPFAGHRISCNYVETGGSCTCGFTALSLIIRAEIYESESATVTKSEGL